MPQKSKLMKEIMPKVLTLAFLNTDLVEHIVTQKYKNLQKQTNKK